METKDIHEPTIPGVTREQQKAINFNELYGMKPAGKPTTGKAAMLVALTDCKTGLMELGVKEDLFTQVLTYASHLEANVALRATPWVMELKQAVDRATAVYHAEPASYWALAKQLGLTNRQLTELKRLVKQALEVWSNRPGVLRPAR